MFEKVAEEIMRQNGCRTHSGNFIQANKVCELIQKGAELAYNKFNEWHYPSKGELPADDKDMLMSETLLLITKMKGSDCLSLVLGQYNFSTQEFSYPHVVGLTDVYAWKEIVPPSEPMRSLNKEEQKKYTESINKVYKPTGVKLFDKEKIKVPNKPKLKIIEERFNPVKCIKMMFEKEKRLTK